MPSSPSRRTLLGALGAGSAALALGREAFGQAPADAAQPPAFRGQHVDAFMENVNWEEVGRRAEWARKAARV
jgi:hypothetical protein